MSPHRHDSASNANGSQAAPRARLSGWRRRAAGSALLVSLLGCARAPSAPRPQIRSASPSSAPALPPSAEECRADFGAPNRRLTRFELAHAVEDVFGVDAASLRALPAPSSSIGDVPDILVGRLLDTSERFLKPYRVAVDELAVAAAARLAPTCALGNRAEADRDVIDPARCIVEQLRVPAARLWRATPSSEELAALRAAVTSKDPTAQADVAARFRQGITFLLGSPRFYLLENELRAGGSGSESEARFVTRRLLTRLALVLWSSVPDRALLERGERGELADAHEFEAELRRMLEDPRFARFAEEFGRQWLRLDRRPLFRPSLESRSLLEDRPRLARMHGDVAHFLSAQLASERPLAELLTATDAGLNPAAPAEAERAGLLTSQALLSALSTPIRGGGDENWLGRGLLVQSAFLCRSWPLAAVYETRLWEAHPLLNPNLTAASPRPGEPALLTTRTTDRPCRECHRQLETLGATLAAFDGFGEPSSAGTAPPVDIAGQTIGGPRALASFVAASGRFEPCVAQKLLSYVLGRAVLPARRGADRCLVQQLVAQREGAAPTLRSWLWQSLTSAEFRSPGSEVVRDKPTPSPNSSNYTDLLSPIAVTPSSCRHFEAGTFLVDNCGTAACHGAGALTAAFAVSDPKTAGRLLRSSKPSAQGYCGKFASYLDPQKPMDSLIVQKVLGGPGLCGAAMPITGGPRHLGALEHACFVDWLTQEAKLER